MRTRIADFVDGEDAVGGGVAQQVEPAAATGAVRPALGERAFRVAAHEQMLGPSPIIERSGNGRARDVRLAAIVILDFVARHAPRAGDHRHRAGDSVTNYTV